MSCTSTFISQDLIHSMIMFSTHKTSVLTIIMKVSLNVLNSSEKMLNQNHINQNLNTPMSC